MNNEEIEQNHHLSYPLPVSRSTVFSGDYMDKVLYGARLFLVCMLRLAPRRECKVERPVREQPMR